MQERPPVENSDIAEIFTTLADLLEIEGENPFRIRAYRNAARVIEDLPHSVEAMVEEGRDLAELPGIGRDLAGKIEEIVATGRLSLLDEVKARMPTPLAELVALPVLGPKRAKTLHDELGVTTLDELAAAVAAGKVHGLAGFGRKTEERLREELARRRPAELRITLYDAENAARPLIEHLRGAKGISRCVIAGSYRRRKETIRDLDILLTCEEGSDVMDRLVAYEEVEEVLARGSTRSTVRLHSGLQVDVRVVPDASYGAALHYFTGSKAHNIAVRRIALRKGLKLNEYGVFRGETRIAGRTEEEVFEQAGLPYVDPELRENRGEIEAAREGCLPALVALEDLRGDLHAHTSASDGASSLREMAEAARARGLQYLAVTDHVRHPAVARGLSIRRLAEQAAQIDRLNAELEGIVLLKSAEVSILEDGSLGLPPAALERLDLTVCAVHDAFDLSREQQTERVIRAMENPFFNILGHPTGRLLNAREPYELDFERVLEAALDLGCSFELNARPDRLDLNDLHCRMAKEMGVKVAVSTDAHSVDELDFMRFGIGQARRGWLEPHDVLNTRPLEALQALLRRS